MRRFVRPVVASLVMVAASGLALPAGAQVDSREGIALQNEIYQLRQELRTLEGQLAQGGVSRQPSYNPPSPRYNGNDIVAQLLSRVDALEDQVRQLRGQVDETQNRLQQQNADLGKRIDDLAFQVNQQAGGLQGGNPTSGGLSGGVQSGPPTAFPPLPRTQTPAPPPSQGQPTVLAIPTGGRPPGPRLPELALQEGNAALARHDYPAAEAAAREVLANRTSPRAYDAQLLLAQALSGDRQFAQSAIAFDDAYNRSRKGTHAEDALVGLANSLVAINEKKAACDTLTRLRAEFPQPRPDIRDNAGVTAQRAGCRNP